MATISLPGVYSGIDTTSIITQLMAINRQPLDRLNVQKADTQSKEDALDSVSTKLTQFQTLASNLKGVTNIAGVAASTSDSKVLYATAGAGASEGTHTVTVHQMATADREVQAGIASMTTTLGATGSSAVSNTSATSADETWFTTGENGATYAFNFGSEAAITTVTLAANTSYTMNQVKDLINTRSQAVSGYDAASVQVDGDGNAHLKLASKGAGPIGTVTATLTSGDAVSQLATDGWASTNGTAGKFVYTYNGVTRTLTTSATTTLQSLSDLINNDTGNPGVRASVLNYKVDADHQYHLVLSGAATGTDHAITIETGTTLAGFGPGSSDWTRTQTAQNAQVRIDGYPSNDPADTTTWIERDSNTITDIIPGVTVTLQGAGTANVSLTRDTSTLVNDLQNLVALYNSVSSTISGYTSYDTTNKKAGLLQGDSGLNQIANDIRSPLVNTLTGFMPGQQTFTMAADLGITIDKTGKLSLDTDILNAAVAEDYNAVLNVVGAIGAGETTNSKIQFSSATGNTQAGSYDVQVDYSDIGNVTAARIRKSGEQIWRNMDMSGNSLTGKSGTAESGMILTATWDGSSMQTATVTVRQGIANQMYNSMQVALDDTTGTIVTSKSSYEALMKTIDDNITRMNERLATEQANLNAQYARLEATLATLDAQRAQYDALLGTSSTSSSSSSSSSSSK